MTPLDWVVLLGTTLFIVAWGVFRYRGEKTAAGYLRGGNSLGWGTIGLSVMATQASAVTFLSVPGQAYEDGMRFVQFYFGMPIAIVVVAAVFLPIYYRLKVYTAYEYLEQRFDLKTRLLGATLFLISRGLAAGITIYAPGILLSAILGWPLELTNVGIGVAVILYTVSGGSKAVSQTQKQQMVVVMLGLVAAGVAAALALPDGVGVGDAVELAGALGRMNAVDASFAFEDRYNLWSGLAGGFFLSLSYFGTDQSQVGRYLGGKDLAASRLGLLFNGFFKIPMQAGILFIGILVFAVYLFHRPPVFWNQPALDAAMQTEQRPELERVTAEWSLAFDARKAAAERVVASTEAAETASAEEALVAANARMDALRSEAKALIKAAVPAAETKDSDYIFLGFALSFLPAGLLGLLIAVILSAAMSSIAGELNALGSTTAMDWFVRLRKKPSNDWEQIRASKWFTVLWGLVAIGFATFAAMLDNLIQAVNILGSLFYGTVLGIFVVAFALKKVRGTAVFWAAAVSELAVISVFAATDLGFLWFNVIGCLGVVALAPALQGLFGQKAARTAG
jgi:SSS family solute:Na+ symporter